jgi:hypothetical protein
MDSVFRLPIFGRRQDPPAGPVKSEDDRLSSAHHGRSGAEEYTGEAFLHGKPESGPFYRHENIPEGSFRLLTVIEVEPDIAANIEVFPIDSYPAYGALSYSQGTQRLTKKFLCNGGIYPVTAHLYEGLRFFFYTSDPNGASDTDSRRGYGLMPFAFIRPMRWRKTPKWHILIKFLQGLSG